VKLADLRVEGFGKLVDRHIAFDPRFNVVYGPNEAGKSTVTAVLLAALYGFTRGEKEQWRPWSGTRYAAALTYTLADGRHFEIRRDFERDQKGIHVYDESGADVSAVCSVGKVVSPGHAHLGIPLEVFLNASFVAQGFVTIDGARAERITHALAHALDGGPKEDAALGAIGRLEDALATYVGKKRATVNAPLRHLYEQLEDAEVRAREVRERLRTLDDIRARLEAESQRLLELEAAQRDHERRARAFRAYTLRSRLDALREIRDELAALQAARAAYDDVDGFPSYLVAELEELYRESYTLDALARSQAEEAARARMTPALLAELDERCADGGSLDDQEFDNLQAAGAATTAARNAATLAADQAQVARRSIEGGGEIFGVAFTAGAFVALGAVIFGLFQQWIAAGIVAVVAVAILAFAGSRWQRRRAAARTVERMQKRADEAIAAERTAAARVASVLEPLGVASIEELGKRRARAAELSARRAEAARLQQRAHQTRTSADKAAAAFDDMAARLKVATGSRKGDLTEAKVREARKSARDGIDSRLSMLDFRRTDVLGTDAEFALESELADLLAAKVEPAPLRPLTDAGEAASPRAFEAERYDLERRASDSRSAVASSAAEFRTWEAQIGDLAALDEQASNLRAEAQQLERFEAAVELAKDTIEERTREAHLKFARRLADYASKTFGLVTAGRYTDLRIDPTTLAVRVRVPETGDIIDVERLSMGTRDQAYLVVRLAMARMFAEGLETAPLLLDDPFAYWDEARIARCLPILESVADGAQIILFTSSRELADGAAQRGARLIEINAQVPTPLTGVS